MKRRKSTDDSLQSTAEEPKAKRRAERKKIDVQARRPYATWSHSETCQKILPAFEDGQSFALRDDMGRGRCVRKRDHLGSHTQFEPLASLLDALGREETIADLLVLMRSQHPLSADEGCRCCDCVETLPN